MRGRRGEEGARKFQKKPKPKQQRRRREPEAPGEQEVREGTRRGLKRHAEFRLVLSMGLPTFSLGIVPLFCAVFLYEFGVVN